MNTNKSYIDGVKSIAEKYGLKLLAVSTGFGTWVSRTDSEDKIKILTKVSDVAAKLNIPIVSIRPFGKPDDKETTRQEFSYIRKLSEQAASRGITLAITPHIAASVYNIATTIQMLDEIDSPALGVNVDYSKYTKAETILQKLF